MKQILEKVRKLMARPTTLRPVDGGEIVLKNCTKETIDKVKDLLAGKYDGEAESPETPTPKAAPTPASVAPAVDEAMPSPALGIYQNPLTLNWHICDIKFSPTTRRGMVINDKPLGRDKYECDEHFKIKAVQNGMVG